MPPAPRRTLRRHWVPTFVDDLVDECWSDLTSAGLAADTVADRIDALVERNRRLYDVECVNLNPATSTLSRRAAAALDPGLSNRPSLGHPGDKYETGLEAIEAIEIAAAELAALVFDADFAEVRVPSGAIANLYAFMATCRPGDPIIVPPATIAGHVTHQQPGAAGLYGLDIHDAPIDAERYTVDVDGVDALARRVEPKLITIGCSLNLTHHDVAGLAAVAHACGARLLFDAAHLSGPIAGGVWPNPLASGADLMTMSTYKSLGGPAGGLLVTNDAELAERVDRIAFPGLTANFDAGTTAALAVTLAEWLDDGPRRAELMIECAGVLADALADLDVPSFAAEGRATRSHAFAIDARSPSCWTAGGTAAARHLGSANLLCSAIGLPSGLDDGVRIGTNELVQLGARAEDMTSLADLVAHALRAERPADLMTEVAAFRARLD